jgi:hypothetical protein
VAENPNIKKKAALLADLRDQERQAVRNAALTSTWFMATMVLWPDVAKKHYWEPAHKPEQDWLDGIPHGGKRAIRIHREGRKTMMNVARCVRLVCANPNIRIMLVSSYQRTAIDMCGLIKRQFVQNASFRYYFPEFAVDDLKWGKQDEFTHSRRTMVSLLDPTLLATYLGAPLISRRCDVWIGDDPVDEDMVANPDIAQTTMDKFTQIVPLIDKTSDYKQTIFIGTPKAHTDPLAAICGQLATSDVRFDKEVVGGWEVLTRPVSYIPSSDFLSGGEFAFPDENPEAVVHLPNVHTPADIREIYNECKKNPAKGEAYFFREYAMMVQAPGDQKVLAEWLDTWVDPQMVPPNTVFTGIAVDSALKDEQVLFKGDNMAVLIGHFDTNGNLYLTDGARSRGWRSDDFRKVLLAMVQNPKNKSPQNFIKEKVAEGGQFFTEAKRWFTEARRPIVTFPIPAVGQGKKMLKIVNALQGPLMGRKIFFVKGQFPEEMHKVLVDELIHLGQWGHDDVADALALFFHPDVRPQTQMPLAAPLPPRMTRIPQLSTMRTVPGMLGWQAKSMQSRPQIDSSGAMVDQTKEFHEQVIQQFGFARKNSLDQMGQRHNIDLGTGQVIKP